MAESRKREKCVCLDLGEREWQAESRLGLLKTAQGKSGPQFI